jgi:hypothetical protein
MLNACSVVAFKPSPRTIIDTARQLVLRGDRINYGRRRCPWPMSGEPDLGAVVDGNHWPADVSAA